MPGEVLKYPGQIHSVLICAIRAVKSCGDYTMSEEEFLVPNDVYMKSGVHIGTKTRTTYMDAYIYKTRPDGLSVLNVHQIDAQIRIAAAALAKHDPEKIILVCRRENGWRPAKLFAKYTGAKAFIGRYPPGILTNPKLENFIEGEVLLVTDVWPDRNAVKDGRSAGMSVIALCDSNNETQHVDIVVPCNNKGKQSLGLVYYLLVREYLAARGLPFDAKLEDFSEA